MEPAPTYCNTVTVNSSGWSYLDITIPMKAWVKNMLGESGERKYDRGFLLQAFGKRVDFASSCHPNYKPYFYVTYYEDVSLPNGTYFIRNASSNNYLDVCGGTATNYTNVWEYSFNGTPAQQWIVTRDSNGYCQLIPGVSSSFRLYLNGPSAQILTNSNANAQKWRIIQNYDGTYRIMPISSTPNALQKPSNSTYIQSAAYTAAKQQKWVFEDARTIGQSVPNTYSVTKNENIHCYAFGLKLYVEYLDVENYVKGDSVETTANYILSQFSASKNPKLYDRSVRRIGKHDMILYQHEFKMVLKTRPHVKNIFGGTKIEGDYHFLIQCNDGSWAHKLSWLNSLNLGNINPDSGDWNYGGVNPRTGKMAYGSDPYTSEAIYFAVRMW